MKLEMYSTYAKEYDAAIQDNVYNAHYERATMYSLLGDLKGLKVLDLGCGSGVYAEYLLANGAAEVTGIDASPEMVGILKEKLGERVKAYTQDLSLGLPEEKDTYYDLVVCPLMIHYLEDLQPLFRDIARVLKSGGKFLFSTHHPLTDVEFSLTGNYFDREFVTQTWYTIGFPVEVQFYRRSLTEIVRAITKAGMGIVDLSEGEVAEKVKEISPDHFEKLTREPVFLFVMCQKLIEEWKKVEIDV